MRVFSLHGFNASGVERVLREGGISRMTLYNHFASKEDLIVAALRRRDEIFRDRMMRYAEWKADSPRERVLAVFGFLEQWFNDAEFSGCMFINAAAEFDDPRSEVRRLAAEHKRSIVAYLADLCRASGHPRPEHAAEELGLLIDGAIVSARVVYQAQAHAGGGIGAPARLAREMAVRILDEAV
jgi:AcrR family transcriptional regulator